MTTNFNSLIQVLDFFKEDAICIEYLKFQRWGNNEPTCPHCGSAKKAYVTNRGYKCSDKDCYKKFSVISGTIFENTKIPLRTWFAAIYLCTAHKKGISSLQLSRDLNITQKSAWFLLHRVREMLANNAPEMLEGVVEADETYVGGKSHNKHASKKPKANNKSHHGHTPVIGLVQRGGAVKTFVRTDAKTSTMFPIVTQNVDRSAQLITDAWQSYNVLGRIYNHTMVKVDKGYITHGEKHTNTIEGFWSQLKRGIIGIYHQVSPKHLQRYCDEFSYRYNTRKVSDVSRFNESISNANGRRLKYADLIK